MWSKCFLIDADVGELSSIDCYQKIEFHPSALRTMPMKKLLLIFLFGVLAGSFLPFLNTDQSRTSAINPGYLIAVATLPDGGLYEGSLENGILHGQGKIQWPDGSSYQGQFKAGSFHGQGRLEMASGDVYEGDFFESEMTGQGIFEFANGDHYEGEVKNGLLEGEGTLKESSGACYTGHFRDDDFHGQGVYCDGDGNKYSGEFVAGSFTGQGRYTDDNGDVYQGGFKDWSFEGEGTYTSAVGDQYIGSFVDGNLTGKGEYTGEDGEHYQGEFDFWGYDGKGHLVTAEGDKYEGQFSNGRYDGQGSIRYAKPLDGINETSGEWRRGVLIRSDDGRIVNDPKVLAETVLYNQNVLLEKSWKTLQDNNPDDIDLYFLGIAGDGKQAVFRREVQFVSDYFKQRFATEGKSISLINDRSTVADVPLATVTSIKQSLQQIAARMDAENDILFIYMNSHGSNDFEFSLQQSGVSLANLPAKTLAELLENVPVRWKVVVVSACYSGGFVPELADENTLVITAAADDRSSFGCSDRAEFTYFGEAFFKQALPLSDSFASAFEKAASMLTIREFFKGYKSSKPQLHMGDDIKQHLQRWREQLAQQSDKQLMVIETAENPM